MGEKHVVRFEPVGIEIEVDEDQTVLRAAAEQGITLMHGCKEGQCASCKSFVLDGDDIELDKYSTFALPDYELEEGFTLLCRAHVFEDVTIELLNYDEEMIRSGHPIQEAVAEVVSNDRVTHDMRHLVLKLIEPAEIAYWPGQYVDIALAGHRRDPVVLDGQRVQQGERAARVRHQVYPDGKFSHFLDTELAVGDRLDVTGPFGVFTLRDGRDADMRLRRRRRRDGADPVAAALPGRAREAPARRRTTTAPAPSGTCASRRSCTRSTETLPNFRFVPALSEADDGEPWDGEVGLITDVVKKHETDLSAADSYVCGPPPMVEAAMDRARRTGRTREAHLLRQVHHHRFSLSQGKRKRGGSDHDHRGRGHRTQLTQAGVHRRRGRRQGVPGLDAAPLQLLHAAEAQADPLRGRHRRGAARPAALPDPGLAVRVLRRPRRLPAGLDRAQGVGLDRPDPERYPGSGGKGYDWPAHGWHEFRDPNEEWELTLYRYNANVVRQINQNIETARQSKAFEQWNRNWVTFVERNVGAWMHVEHGLGLYLFANANRRAPTNMHNNAISVNSMHRIRFAQDLALYNLTLSEEIEGFDGTAHVETWNSDPAWQGVRRVAEQLTAIDDWAEAIFAANIVFEPLVGELFRSHLVQQAAPGNGDFVTPTVVGAGEYDYAARDLRYTKAMFELLTNDKEFADHNKALMDQWLSTWVPRCLVAARSCSRCGRSPTPSRRGSRTAWTGPRAGSAASSPT